MAIAAFKLKMFETAESLADFVKNDASVNTVVSINFDGASGKWVLFYTSLLP